MKERIKELEQRKEREEEKMTNLYSIHNASIARELIEKGFELIKVEPNKKNNRFSVYYFNDSVALQNALVSIYKERGYTKK